MAFDTQVNLLISPSLLNLTDNANNHREQIIFQEFLATFWNYSWNIIHNFLILNLNFKITEMNDLQSTNWKTIPKVYHLQYI